MSDIELVVKISEEEYVNIKKALNSLIENGVDLAHMSKVCLAIKNGKPIPKGFVGAIDKIRAEIEQLPTKTRTNWDGCCPDIDYPEIEYVDVTKKKLLGIIDKYRIESEE